MNSPKKNPNNESLIKEFLANGGTIKICKPKLAPKRRLTSGKVHTRDQLKTFIDPRSSRTKVA